MGKPTLYNQAMIAEYTKNGYWDSVTVADTWDQRAQDLPDKEALVDARKRLTWSEAKQWTDRFALALLELGYQKDEIIVIQLPNCAELLLSQVACEKAGVLCLPVPPALRQREMAYILRKVEAKGIIIRAKFRDFDYFAMLEEISPDLPCLRHVFVTGEEVPPGTLSVKEMVASPIETKYPQDLLTRTRFGSLEFSRVQLTTGSTGFPKFVEAPICGRMRCARVYAEACRLSVDDVCGVFTPGPGGPGFIGVHSAPLVGARIVMLEKFEAGDALRLIEKEKISMVGVVPTMLAKMIDHPDFDRYDLGSLRFVLVTGAPLPAKLAERADAKLGFLIQTYGAMDFGGITAPFIDSTREVRLFTANKPIPGNQLKIQDEQGSEVRPGEIGEILVKGPTSTSGFFKDLKATRETWSMNGWFCTGDLGRIDDQGNLIILGRKKEVIIRGGQNIYPAEVESILQGHPKVASVAVVPIPDDIMGEKACACVVPEKGHSFSFGEMVSFLENKNIAKYKFPERLEIMLQFPLVAGLPKIDKKKLTRQIRKKITSGREKHDMAAK